LVSVWSFIEESIGCYYRRSVHQPMSKPAVWSKEVSAPMHRLQKFAFSNPAAAIWDHTNSVTCYPSQTQVNADGYSMYLPRNGMMKRMERPEVILATSRSQVRRPDHYTTEPLGVWVRDLWTPRPRLDTHQLVMTTVSSDDICILCTLTTATVTINNNNIKGAITSKIKHAIKLKTSPAGLAQLLQPSLAFWFSLQPMTAHRLVLSFIACFILVVIAP